MKPKSCIGDHNATWGGHYTEGTRGFRETDLRTSLAESGRKSWRRARGFRVWGVICPVSKGKQVVLGPLGNVLCEWQTHTHTWRVEGMRLIWCDQSMYAAGQRAALKEDRWETDTQCEGTFHFAATLRSLSISTQSQNLGDTQLIGKHTWTPIQAHGPGYNDFHDKNQIKSRHINTCANAFQTSVGRGESKVCSMRKFKANHSREKMDIVKNTPSFLITDSCPSRLPTL